MATRTISILGCGWLGLPLGAAFAGEQGEGHRVKGATTTPGKRRALREAGIEPHLVRLAPGLDDEKSESAAGFFDADVLVFTVPPSTKGDAADRVAFYRQQVRATTEAARAAGVRHLLYTSSTGVYPPLGREVTEEDGATEAQAADLERASSRVVLAAERALVEEAARADFDLTVVRLAGLYGPGREPGRFLAGKEELAEGGRPVNFVHLDDAVGVLRAVIAQDAWGEVFNACADRHPSRRTFFQKRAESAGLDPPTFAGDERGAFKIVSSAKVKERLGYVFRHPDPLA